MDEQKYWKLCPNCRFDEAYVVPDDGGKWKCAKCGHEFITEADRPTVQAYLRGEPCCERHGALNERTSTN